MVAGCMTVSTHNPPRFFHGCRFDIRDGSLVGSGGSPSLTLRPQAARLLGRFLDQPGEIIDRDSLIAAVWDEGRVVDFESGLAALLREVRSALDEVGAGGDLIETVPRRGYRFLGHVDVSARRETGPGRKRIGLLVVLAMAVLTAALLMTWVLQIAEVEEKSPGALAIIPFELYGDTGEDKRRVELLLADTILAHLWQAELEDLVLIGRATLRPYEGREDVAAAVARDLGVQFLIEGTVQVESAGYWTVNARLLQMPAGTVVWSSSMEWEARSVLPVSDTAEFLVSRLVEDWDGIRSKLGLGQISE